ncbi:hypothetical protein VTK73DRAFT_6435 [Phialemonium thermophilum]|uniref:Uncharacterized protein n=1 Tax=Phialemonium thermophilum TaxID=223376 RepID=A0ABR3UZI3_9PEZI
MGTKREMGARSREAKRRKGYYSKFNRRHKQQESRRRGRGEWLVEGSRKGAAPHGALCALCDAPPTIECRARLLGKLGAMAVRLLFGTADSPTMTIRWHQHHARRGGCHSAPAQRNQVCISLSLREQYQSYRIDPTGYHLHIGGGVSHRKESTTKIREEKAGRADQASLHPELASQNTAPRLTPALRLSPPPSPASSRPVSAPSPRPSSASSPPSSSPAPPPPPATARPCA